MIIRKYAILLVCCLVLVSLIVLLNSPGRAQLTTLLPSRLSSGWSIECVDCPKSFLSFSDRGLQIDGYGHSHIAYGGDQLYYAWHDGIQWHYETVDTTRGTGISASLALDGNDYPHIAYYDRVNGDLKYVYQDIGGWHIQTVDSQDDVGANSSLALDTSGLPHISYYDVTNQDLKYATFNGSTWITETVDTVGDVGSYNSIAIDSNDYPHISYYDATGDHPKYTHWNGVSWDIQSISSTNGGQYTSIAVDNSDLPHISFFHRYVSFYYLMYAHWNGSSWEIQEVDPENYSGYYTSIVLDSADHPYIATQTAIGTLKYAGRNGSTWEIETVDSSGNVYESVSLALDSDGIPRIAYQIGIFFTNPEHSLKQASWNGSAWDFETIDTASEANGPTSLALDELGKPQVAYRSGVFVMGMPSANLSHAQWDGSTWQTQIVDGGGGVTGLSMDVEPNGTAHIVYYDDILDAYRYAHWTGSSWDIQTVGPGYGYVSIALDSLGYPHLAYFYSGLSYVYWDGNAWVYQIVDNSGYTSGGVALALDAQGYAHISYCLNHNIKYAYWDGSQWSIQTVDSNIGVYESSTSLALDSLGNTHISYYSDYPNGVLKYATQTEELWNIQVVDSGGDVGNDNSIAVDSLDYPHISYLDTTNADLKYASWDGSSWLIQTITDVGYASGLTSLKLDAADDPHISYFDWTTRDIMLAHYTGEPVAPQSVVLSGPDSGDVQSSLTFTAIIVPISTTLPIQYVWEATDQSPITQTGSLVNTARFAWDTPGTQVITVTASNAYGEVSDTHEITIFDVPITGLTAVNDSPTTLGEATTLTGTVTAGTNIYYKWDFGDGITGDGTIVTHTYPDIGLYTATVTATNSINSEVTFTPAYITDVPISGLTASNDSPTALGEVTTLTATVTAGTNISFSWDFGDGTSGDGAIVTHTYTDIGFYTATVTAINGVSNINAATPVTILPIGLPNRILLPMITKQ